MSTGTVDPQVHNLLSEAARCLAGNQTTKAKKLCEKAVMLAPASADVHMVLADVLAARSETALARKHYEKATQYEKNHFGAWLNYGVFLKENNELRNAVLAFKNASMIDPKSSQACYNVARALLDVGEYREAVDAFRAFVRMEPKFPDGFLHLAACEELAGDYDAAVESTQKALQLNPELARAHLQLGALYQSIGRFDEAETSIRKGIALDPVAGRGYESLLAINSSADADKQGDSLAEFQERLKDDSLDPAARSHILFAAAKILDRRNDFDAAFEYMAEANAIRNASVGTEYDERTESWRRIPQFFNEEFFSNWSLQGDQSTQPVFVVGMPRSGTTLVEQILATHSRGYGAGELRSVGLCLTDAAAALGGKYPDFVEKFGQKTVADFAKGYLSRYPTDAEGFDRVVDKTPQNFVNLGLLALVFPNAKFVFCRRNALDTCLSCYMQDFLVHIWYTFDLEKLAEHYRLHIDIMDHWRKVLPGRIHEVRYEEMTADPEPNIRALLDFCDLDWEDACLEFHKTDRGVRTSSVWQVRQPMYTTSVERWKHYKAHLGPLIEGLGDLAES